MFDSENRNEGWEKQLLEKLAFSSVQEQRRARRWSILFKSLTFVVSQDHEHAENGQRPYGAPASAFARLSGDGDNTAG